MRFLTLAAIATLSVAACTPAEPAKKAADTSSSYDTAGKDADKSAMAKPTDSAAATSSTATGGASSNLPAGVVLYPGAKFTKTGSEMLDSMKADEKAGRTGATFSTTDAPAKVVAFYKDEFTKAGMTQKGGGEMGPLTIVSYTKGAADPIGMIVVVGARPDGSTSFEVMYPTPT